MMLEVRKSGNGIDLCVYRDGKRIGRIDLVSASASKPFSAKVGDGRSRAQAIGEFANIEQAAQAIARAHAARNKPQAPVRKKLASKPAEPQLRLEPSREHPQTNWSVWYGSDQVGRVARLPTYDGKPYQAKHLTGWFGSTPEFAAGGMHATKEEAARQVLERWAVKRPRKPDWVR